jgi:hypothetical protein
VNAQKSSAEEEQFIFKSPYSDIDIPVISFSELILSKCEQYGDKVALVNVMTGRKKTYREIVNESKRFAAGLASRGFKKVCVR